MTGVYCDTMKEYIYIIIDIEESDPEEAIFAIMNNRGAAERVIDRVPSRNLTIVKREVFGSVREVRSEIEF